MSDESRSVDEPAATEKGLVPVTEGGEKMQSSEKFLRTSEVARLLHVSPKTVSRWAKEGRLPHLSTLGGHRRFPASEVEKLLKGLTEVPVHGKSEAV